LEKGQTDRITNPVPQSAILIFHRPDYPLDALQRSIRLRVFYVSFGFLSQPRVFAVLDAPVRLTFQGFVNHTPAISPCFILPLLAVYCSSSSFLPFNTLAVSCFSSQYRRSSRGVVLHCLFNLPSGSFDVVVGFLVPSQGYNLAFYSGSSTQATLTQTIDYSIFFILQDQLELSIWLHFVSIAFFWWAFDCLYPM
jgi:hypothetical protein